MISFNSSFIDNNFNFQILNIQTWKCLRRGISNGENACGDLITLIKPAHFVLGQWPRPPPPFRPIPIWWFAAIHTLDITQQHLRKNFKFIEKILSQKIWIEQLELEYRVISKVENACRDLITLIKPAHFVLGQLPRLPPPFRPIPIWWFAFTL